MFTTNGDYCYRVACNNCDTPILHGDVPGIQHRITAVSYCKRCGSSLKDAESHRVEFGRYVIKFSLFGSTPKWETYVDGNGTC